MSIDILPWTEKYRPTTLDGVVGQKDIIKSLKSFVKQKNMPNLLFAGPPGIGKTTATLALAKELFGDAYKGNVLELNASDERGIDIVRGKIKEFARMVSLHEVPFKIIFLDEADALTPEAQHALRRTMEIYSDITRFILSCVTPDTKVLLPNDIEITMERFMQQYKNKKQKCVRNLCKEGNSMKNDLVLAYVEMPPAMIGKKVLEISTMTGRKIKVTDDHKLLTTEGWKSAGRLSEQDKLLIHPHLTGVGLEDRGDKIIDLNSFINFISDSEGEEGFKDIHNAQKYRHLKNKEKDKIIERVIELKGIMDSNIGLTNREFEIYQLIKKFDMITRKKIQDKVGLSRLRIDQILHSVEKKSFIKRIVNKKEHSFVVTKAKPLKLRNYRDIQHFIEREFNLKISYKAVRDALLKGKQRGRVDRVIGELKRKDLLDVTYNDIEKVGALSRLCGFLLGDGHLARNNVRLHFSGNEIALLNVKRDLDIIGYTNHSNIRTEFTDNILKGKRIRGKSTSFTLDTVPLSLLFQYFGTPKGDKVVVDYKVPKFIMNGTKFVKREFLRALFGCDAGKPRWRRMSLETISLRQNKIISMKKSMLIFYGQLRKLFKEFEINTNLYVRYLGEIRKKDGKEVLVTELHIKSNNKNMLRFLSRVGYYYEDYKQELTSLSSEYLRHKLFLIELWEKKSVAIVQEYNSSKTKVALAQKYDVNVDFITNQLKGKEVHLPRNKFINFDSWVEQYKYNNNLIANDIFSIREINANTVVDITCNKDHNFISNGFVSHNCNYSSKIIEPLQSRCSIFRFTRLSDNDVKSMLTHVIKEEGLKADDKAIESIIYVSEGDVRKAINVLQGAGLVSDRITQDLIYKLASRARPQEIREMIDYCLNKKFLDARKKLDQLMVNYGMSGEDVLLQIYKEVPNLDIPDEKKVILIDRIGEYNFRLVEGANERIQLEALLGQLMLLK